KLRSLKINDLRGYVLFVFSSRCSSRAKGALSHKTARLMVFKLVMSAAKTWRRLKGENQLPMVIAGVKFTNGVAQSVTPDHRAA
ncbi:hypothetical protein ACWGTI_31675, partial [Mesorhizobium sp. ArgA1]